MKNYKLIKQKERNWCLWISIALWGMVVIFCLCGCKDNYVVTAKSYTTYLWGSLPNGICIYRHDEYKATMDSCGKYNIGDTIKQPK